MSLRDRLNAMGIDGHSCESLINEYYELVRIMPTMRMNLFLQTVRDSRT